MKKLTVTPQSPPASVTVAQRIAFLNGQEEILRLDHDALHQKIVDVREVRDSPSTVLLDMVGLQGTVFAVEADIRDAREGIRLPLIQAYKDAGSQYAHFYAKEIFGTPANAPLKLVSKRSGKHKASTEEAVEHILCSKWWQEYVEQERSLLADRSRAKSGIKDVSESHADAVALHDALSVRIK